MKKKKKTNQYPNIKPKSLKGGMPRVFTLRMILNIHTNIHMFMQKIKANDLSIQNKGEKVCLPCYHHHTVPLEITSA